MLECSAAKTVAESGDSVQFSGEVAYAGLISSDTYSIFSQWMDLPSDRKSDQKITTHDDKIT